MTPLSVEFTLLNVISFLQKIKVTKMILNSVLKAGGGGRGVSDSRRKRGEGGLNMAKNKHFVCMFIENGTISEILKDT